MVWDVVLVGLIALPLMVGAIIVPVAAFVFRSDRQARTTIAAYGLALVPWGAAMIATTIVGMSAVLDAVLLNFAAVFGSLALSGTGLALLIIPATVMRAVLRLVPAGSREALSSDTAKRAWSGAARLTGIWSLLTVALYAVFIFGHQ